MRTVSRLGRAGRPTDQVVGTEPEPEFFHQGNDGWRGFTAFLLASTTNPAGMGGARGRGIGTATPDSIAIVLSNGGLVSAGSNEARNELTQALITMARTRPARSHLHQTDLHP